MEKRAKEPLAEENDYMQSEHVTFIIWMSMIVILRSWSLLLVRVFWLRWF